MSPLFPNEATVLNKLRKGDMHAYRFLFDNYYPMLFLYAKKLTKCKLTSEDIVQNVFLSVWTHRDDIKIKTSIKSYLYKAVYNIFVTHYHRQLKEICVLQEIHSTVLQTAIEEEENRIIDKVSWMNAEIDKLPKKAKTIFKLNKMRGLSYSEIADMLDISEKTVESHISRALKRLRTVAKEVDLFSIFF